MRSIFVNATAAETRLCSRSAKQLSWVLPRGILKWYNSGTGTGTLILTDNFTKEVLLSETVAATDGGSSVVIDVPSSYTLELTQTLAGLEVNAGIDGDMGDSGKVV